MERMEYWSKFTTATVAVAGLLAALWGGWQAFLTYRQHAELQANRALNDAQMKVCLELVQVAAKMFSAPTPEKLLPLHNQFGEIKHGVGLMLLDKHVLDASIKVYNDSIAALNMPKGDDYRHRVACKLGTAPFVLVVACRTMLSESLQREAGSPLVALPEGYAMSWKGDCGTVGR